MATDKRIGNKIADFANKATAPGQRFDPGPYIGIVKRTVDSTRTGRLQVYIPELGSNNPELESSWFTVSYASPFGGAVRPTDVNPANVFGQTPNSYGFWMIPPDIGNQVLCTFVGGDPGRGFWFACVNSDLSQHMVPAIGSSDKVDLAYTPSVLGKYITNGKRYPVSEFNLFNENSYNENFFVNPKPLHLPQFMVLVAQGLHNDPIRGSIGSSAQRETPSNVFGFSTPGRAYGLDPADDPSLLQKIAQSNVDLGELRAKVRKGGHSFVLDDGDINGNDRLVRIRTAAGHQILMHDTEKSIYISNATGMNWVELTEDGQVLVYSRRSVSIRTEGMLNLHADGSINMHAGGAIKMYAGKGIVAETPGSMALTGKMGISGTGMSISMKADVSFSASAATASVSGLGLLTLKSSGKTTLAGGITSVTGGLINLLGGVGGGAASAGGNIAGFAASRLFGSSGISQRAFPDTTFVDSQWVAQPNALRSIAAVVPTHEPYTRKSDSLELPGVEVDASGNPVYAANPGEATGPASAQSSGATNGKEASVSAYITQPAPVGGIGKLNDEEVKAYMAQVGYSESAGKYDAVNTYGYLGKYQMGASALIDSGYVRAGTTDSGLSNPANWTGKDGISNAELFLASPGIQEQTMYKYTVNNYNSLSSLGLVTAETSKEEAAGLLSVSHLLGANGAKAWYNGKGGTDAYGTTGDSYYNLGRYSQQVLLVQGTQSSTSG